MYTLGRLRDGHALGEFACGNTELDAWLHNAARTADRAGTARTYVWCGDTDEVVAYFSVAPTAVVRDDLPASIGRGSPEAVPGFLIAKLARHVQLRGDGLGGVLLTSALEVVVDAAADVGGRVVVVDAIDDHAVEFYERHGLRRLGEDSMRLAMKMSTAAAGLDRPWPP